jgi:hypothetical protein
MIGPNTHRAFNRVQDALNELGDEFVEGAQLTFIMRMPGNTEAEMVVTNDDLDEVIATLERSKNRSKVR